jgi:hypothetical protein
VAFHREGGVREGLLDEEGLVGIILTLSTRYISCPLVRRRRTGTDSLVLLVCPVLSLTIKNNHEKCWRSLGPI